MSTEMSDESFEFHRTRAKEPEERKAGPDPATAEVIRRLSACYPARPEVSYHVVVPQPTSPPLNERD